MSGLLYKRKGSPYWYVCKTRESTKTVNRKLAEEYARKALTEHWRTEALGEKTHTWAELCDDWLDIKANASSFDQDRMVIARFSDLLRRLEITALSEITADVLQQYGKVVKAARSAATANRHYTTLRAMLNRAARNGWLSAVPRIENYSLPRKEPRWVTLEQFETILPHLPEWVAQMATAAVQTGMRFANVAGLRWAWISADRTIVIVPAIAAKTRRTYTVPLSKKVQAILEVLEAKRSSSPFPEYVFVGQRRTADHDGVEPMAPVPDIRYWWERAVDLAGFPGLRWHDLRHTWASLHTQRGTPDRILKELGGWASTRMLDTYAHLATSHLVEYAENLNKS